MNGIFFKDWDVDRENYLLLVASQKHHVDVSIS